MQYNIEKRLNEEEDEDEDDDYTTFGPKPKKEETPDPMLSMSYNSKSASKPIWQYNNNFHPLSSNVSMKGLAVF